MLLILSEYEGKAYTPRLHALKPLALLVRGKNLEGDHLQQCCPQDQTWVKACQRLEASYAKEDSSSEVT